MAGLSNNIDRRHSDWQPAEVFALERVLKSRIELISPLVDDVRALVELFMKKFHYREEPEGAIQIALREAVANAMLHGNNGDADKRVYVNLRCNWNGEVSITVRDEGEGFDLKSLPDPQKVESLLRANGRGIYFVRVFMDEVEFDFTRGTEVRMKKTLVHSEP